jgi:uncharacterized membrane protein
MKAILIFLSAFLLASCYYDVEETLYPDSACTPPASPAFIGNVMPILNARCNNCHAGTTASGSIRLDSYNEVIKSVNNGSLMGSINHAGGYSPMPKNASKMSSCEIQTIQNWIDTGKQNN